MAQSLAVKYRPKTWEDVVGQDVIVSILKKQLESGEIKNCLLFCGPSGDGKTTCARIYANELNGGIGSPIEIDAASNNGVDNVRELISQARERALDGKYKVMVIDECHAISNQGWQAFLKCIEEPPKYTVFIFSTTDPQKIPETILNRVQRYNFQRIGVDKIRDRLEYICQQEGLTNYQETIDYISKLSNGGMRYAISLLDKCATSSKNVCIENALKVLGNCSYDMFFKLTNALLDDRKDVVSRIYNEYYNSGADIKQFVEQYIGFCLDIEKFILFNDFSLITIPVHYKDDVLNCVGDDLSGAGKYYMYIIDRLISLKNSIKFDQNARTTIEITLLQIASGK